MRNVFSQKPLWLAIGIGLSAVTAAAGADGPSAGPSRPAVYKGNAVASPATVPATREPIEATKSAPPTPPAPAVEESEPDVAPPPPTPSAARGTDPVPAKASESVVAVNSLKLDQVWALRLADGLWRSYLVPEGMRAVPLVDGDVVALALTGNEIGQVAAFSARTSAWSPLPLRTPAHGKLLPVVNRHAAVYQVGGDVYAFSPATGNWGALHLKPGSAPKLNVADGAVIVLTDNALFVFTETGRWEGVELTGRPLDREITTKVVPLAQRQPVTDDATNPPAREIPLNEPRR